MHIIGYIYITDFQIFNTTRSLAEYEAGVCSGWHKQIKLQEQPEQEWVLG